MQKTKILSEKSFYIIYEYKKIFKNYNGNLYEKGILRSYFICQVME